MPLRDAVVGDTVSYRNAKGGTRNVTVIGTQPAAPVAGDFTVANSGTGGTLGAATYSYRITAVVNNVESVPVAAKTTAVAAGTTNKCTITFPNATASSRYGVYGRVGAAEQLLAYVQPGVAGTWDDTGALTPAGALPTADGRVGVHAPDGGVPTAAGVLKATTLAQTNRYHKR